MEHYSLDSKRHHIAIELMDLSCFAELSAHYLGQMTILVKGNLNLDDTDLQPSAAKSLLSNALHVFHA